MAMIIIIINATEKNLDQPFPISTVSFYSCNIRLHNHLHLFCSFPIALVLYCKP